MKNVAVLGATGLVGETVLRILEQRDFPVKNLYPFASQRSEGQRIMFRDEEHSVVTEIDEFIDDVDIAFGCLDAPLARELLPQIKDRVVIIDNSNAFRMDPEVPLVVPEVNPDTVKDHHGIIANPNCSTIQMVVALCPLHKKARIKRIFVATYQAVSGYGRDAVDELEYEIECLAAGHEIDKLDDCVFKHYIGNNIIPQIGSFDESGYTTEEMKMVNETRKIFNDDSIKVVATCVRIPVYIGHSEVVSVEFDQRLSADEARILLRTAPGVKLIEENEEYPMPYTAAGKDSVYVGRIRKDLAFENGLALWVVADNVRKGAALNAVQIAELLL
jgi:aspartate-semialdehyde dehydrogenase